MCLPSRRLRPSDQYRHSTPTTILCFLILSPSLILSSSLQLIPPPQLSPGQPLLDHSLSSSSLPPQSPPNFYVTDIVRDFNTSRVPTDYDGQAAPSEMYTIDHGDGGFMRYATTDGNMYVPSGDPSLTSHSDEEFHQNTYNAIYNRYLDSGNYNNYLQKCHGHIQEPYGLKTFTRRQFKAALDYAIPRIMQYMAADDEIYRINQNTRFASLLVRKLVHEAKFMEFITQYFVQYHCVGKQEVSLELPAINLKKYIPEKTANEYATTNCGVLSAKPICNPSAKYPSLDGSCNNLKYPNRGKSYTCHRRLLPPDYADGVSAIRASSLGGPLPNARLISNEVHPDVKKLDFTITQMNMQWGQFIVHDITRTGLVLANAPQCCPPSANQHPECERIAPFPPGDSLTRRFNQTCVRQVRSYMCSQCNPGPREQMNAAPSAYDLSNVYGYTFKDSLAQRSFKGGKLAMGLDILGNAILVGQDGFYDPLSLQQCNQPPQYPEFFCFASGDGNRVSQHPALTALQILILRRHNQHAEALAKVNPHWNDEKLYLEARRIMIAESQHITYSAYIPSLFSEELLHYFSILPLKDGYTKYEPHTDHSSISEWITAVGRFGHSQINTQFHVKNYPPMESFTFNIREVFFDMTLIYLGQTDGLIRGLIDEPAYAVDPYFVIDVKDFLYQGRNRSSGLDLLGLNIMRGRDHGVPGYVNYLDYCFGHKVESWKDLHKYIPPGQVRKLKKIYRTVKDIDLFVGAVSETRVPGNAFGPTVACINGIQWYHLKFGDRFFYEHGHEAGSFTLDQLNNIRQTTTLARIICKTTKTRAVQYNVFRFPSKENPIIPCEEFPELDYGLWKEHHHHH